MSYLIIRQRLEDYYAGLTLAGVDLEIARYVAEVGFDLTVPSQRAEVEHFRQMLMVSVREAHARRDAAVVLQRFTLPKPEAS
jgi:hypothetical protein